MSGILLLFLVIGLIWVVRKSSDNSSIQYQVDETSIDYKKGYQDGYFARQKEILSGKNTPQRRNTLLQHLEEVPTQEAVYEGDRQPHVSKQASVPAYAYNNHPMVVSEYVPKESAADLVEQKAKHDLQNINIALYVASFLLVAAAALFIGTSLPESVRFMGVWFITIAFYATGLVLHGTVDKLRPAAVAFTGTGLALLPFTGIAMYNFILHDSAVCWFITSIISLAAFIFAAMRLKNEVLSYLAVAFGVSLSVSSVATLHVGFIWYFVVLIVFGSLMTLLATAKPNWLPKHFSKPVQVSNNWIVPLTIIASILAANSLTTRDYWIISLVSAFYYGAVAVSSPAVRDSAIFVVRLLASFAIFFLAYDLFTSWTAVGLAVSFVGLVQVYISAIYLPIGESDKTNNEIWLWIGLLIQLFAPIFVLRNESWAIITVVQLLAMLVTSFGVSYLLRRAVVSVFGTIALTILPITWGLEAIKPALGYQWISLIFIVFASATIALRSIKKIMITSPSIRPYLLVNFALFIIEALYFTYSVPAGWGFALWSIATLLVYYLMYLERQPWLSILANGMILTSVIRYIEPQLEIHWVSVIFLVLATISIAILALKQYIKMLPSTRLYVVANFGLFLIEALLFTFHIEAGWGFALWSIATLLVYYLMYLERWPVLSVVSNIMIWVSVTNFVQPSINIGWVSLIFMVLALISLAILFVEKQITTSVVIRPYIIINFALFIIQSLILTGGMDKVWGFDIWAVATLSTYCLIYLERQPAISLLSNAMMLVSAGRLIDLLGFEYQWKAIVLSWIAIVVFYGAYLMLEILDKKSYSMYFWWSAIVVGGGINLFNLMSYDHAVSKAAGLVLAIVAVAIAVEGWRTIKWLYVDIGAVLATIGLQRILNVSAPDVNFLVYTHWWAAVVASLSYMYYSLGMKDKAKTRIYIALTVVSFFSGMAALGSYGASDVPYQLIFLIEHIILLVIGLITTRRLFTIWGAVGAILSVLWMVKDFTSLLLALVAFALIAIAVYSLVKQPKK